MGILAVLLTVLFVALKLTEVIAWSWVWVVSPLWIVAIILFLVLVVFGTFIKKMGR
jgi:hypothetical protein